MEEKERYRRFKSILDYLSKYSVKEESKLGKEKEVKHTVEKPKKFIEKVKPKSLWDLEGKVLVIAEKPKAAKKIVEALINGLKPRVLREYNIPYYIIESKNNIVYIASSAGHLFTLYTRDRGYPVFSYEWRPLYEVDNSARYTLKFVKVLEKLCRIADYYINACDYDIEGSVIGYIIIAKLGDLRRSYRVKFSSLTPMELKRSFNNLLDLDWNMIEAGLCRHELDWIWGINVSRALMDSVRSVIRKKVVLSAGRVQTPTLKHVFDVETERHLFIPMPQYVLSVTVSIDGVEYVVEYKGDPMASRELVNKVARTLEKQGYLVVEDYREETLRYSPPPPFNLGDLQEEASKIYGYSPLKTQSIAEQLYLSAYISYPRTNSQKLPKDLDYRGILVKLSEIPIYNSLVKRLFRETKGVLKPVEGPKEDPAHPAIYPTGIIPEKLKSEEQRIYDLIVRRFLAVFAPQAIVVRNRALLVPPKPVNGLELKFVLSGQKIVREGWYKYYPFHVPEEKYVPRLGIGEKIRLVKVRIKKTYTRPPEKLSKIKLLRWMENVNIGTEATRARIIEVLFTRGYLRSSGGKVSITDIGLAIIEVLDEYFKDLTSVELTRRFEEYMEEIREGLKRRSEVIAKAKETISELIKRFNDSKRDIGLKLSWRLGYLVPENKCMLCNREVYNKGLCKYHYEAFNRVIEKYWDWNRRERISVEDYVKSIKKLKITGKWVKDLLSNEKTLSMIYESIRKGSLDKVS